MKKLLNLKLLLAWNVVLTVLIILLFINFSRVADRQSDLNSGLNTLLLDIDSIQTVMAEFMDDMEAAELTMANLKKDIKELKDMRSDITRLSSDLQGQEMTIDSIQKAIGEMEDQIYWLDYDMELEIDHLRADMLDLELAIDDLKVDVDILKDDVQYLWDTK